MQKDLKRKAIRCSRRGQALIVALALIVCLMVLVMATQIQVVAQLAASRRERDFERALQMAEAGANAYLNQLANGFVDTNTYAYMPAWNPLNANPNGDVFPISTSALKQRVMAGTYAITRYPSGSEQGFFVGHAAISGASVSVVSYGWSNGVVRRIMVGANSFSIFDWAALYGINPNTTGQNYCWKFSGSANVVGASGGEGLLVNNNNATWYDGPIIWAGPGAASNPFPSVSTSAPNVPTGHSGTGVLASPLYRRYERKLDLPTADEAANDWALRSLNVTTTQGVAYFRNNNHNATGIRYLVQNTSTGVIRELPGSYSVMGNNDYQLDGEFNPNNGTLNGLGKTSQETFYGLRFYPGNYFFEQITMQNSDKMYLRTFNDSERNTITGRAFVVSGDPANPNSGQADSKNVRIWIGRRTSGNDPQTTFDTNTVMEYPAYASRFRVYVSSTGGVQVRGRNTNPPPPFRVNMLVYNKDSNGNGYGSIGFNSSTYLFGSLIGWQIDVAGGCTVEKEAPELGPGDDRLTYLVSYWKELP